MTAAVNIVLCCAVLVIVVVPLAWAIRTHSTSAGEPPARAAMPH